MLLNRPIRNKNCMWRPSLGQHEQSLQRTFKGCFILNFSLFGKAVSEKKIIRHQPIKNKNGLWWPCLLTDRNFMRNIQSGQSEHASYQGSIHLSKWFQRIFFYKWPIRNQNCLWRPCLLMDRDEMSNLHRESSIDAPDQVSIDLDEGSQRKILKSEQLMDDGRRNDGNSSKCI